MEDKIRVVVCKPDEEAYITEIDNTLQAMQDLVGGCIQAIHPWKLDATLVCNEEGFIEALACNRIVCGEPIFGTFFICWEDGDEFASLDEKLAKGLRHTYGKAPRPLHMANTLLHLLWGGHEV